PWGRPWCTDWQLGGRLFTLGPTRLLLLRADDVPAGFDSASRYLSRGLKGCYAPLDARPGTIRGHFNAVNQALNLVHAADRSGSVLSDFETLGIDVDQIDLDGTAPAPVDDEPRLFDFPSAILDVYSWLLVELGRDAGLRTVVREVVDRARSQ